MRQADLREAIAGALTAETPNDYYTEMRYPKVGGYRAFLNPLVDAATIVPDHRATRIDMQDRVVDSANGRRIAYRHLVSTMPLSEMISDVPESVRDDARSLFATRIDLISIGFAKPSVSPALWLYLYDREILAARAYSPDWKSPANVPPECRALQFEIYSSRESPQTRTRADLIENTLDAIVRMGLANRDDILFAQHDHVPTAMSFSTSAWRNGATGC